MNYPAASMIIAELSANHGQNKETAIELVRQAKKAGADAVKVQTYTPDTITFKSQGEAFRIKDQELWKDRYLWDLYNEAYTPWEWQPELKELALAQGMEFVASVFDPSSVEFWEQYGLETYKIASAEIVDIPLLKLVAQTGKRIILSTGMATIAEIKEAVETIRATNSSPNLTLLKCSSAYPAPVEEMNLQGIRTLKSMFALPVGLSDHSLTDEVAVTAVGLGATIFEKHLKLEEAKSTADDAFSLTPSEFEKWASSIRTATRALGSLELAPSETERATLPFRKSLFVVKDIQKGKKLTSENVRSIRPAAGLHPKYFEEILGKTVKESISAGTPLSFDLIN
ncbi:MAG: pseudaminic acid synthase [Opitutales bacterium]|nr:pseudaminic acid synthase [Opitutales bacterium]